MLPERETAVYSGLRFFNLPAHSSECAPVRECPGAISVLLKFPQHCPDLEKPHSGLDLQYYACQHQGHRQQD